MTLSQTMISYTQPQSTCKIRKETVGREFPGGLVVKTCFHLLPLASTAMAWVQSLVGELRSCKPWGAAERKVKGKNR